MRRRSASPYAVFKTCRRDARSILHPQDRAHPPDPCHSDPESPRTGTAL